MPRGMKIKSSVCRYRRKKYASSPHFLITSRSLNWNMATNQPQGVRGGGSVRSFSGTKYVFGLLIAKISKENTLKKFACWKRFALVDGSN